jgi:hypothetical protein
VTIATRPGPAGRSIDLVEEGKKAEQPPYKKEPTRELPRRRSMSMDRDYQTKDQAYDSINSRLIYSIGAVAVAILGLWMLLTLI